MVAVHAVGMIYTLRSVSMRLRELTIRNADLLYGIDRQDIEWLQAMIDSLIRRIEYVPSYIVDPAAAEPPPSEVDLGKIN